MQRSTQAFLCAAGVLLAPGMAGCGGGGGTTSTNPTPQPHSVSAVLPNGLTATVTQDGATVPVGGVFTYTLSLTNATAQPITFQPERTIGFSVGVGDELTVKNATGGQTYPAGEYSQELTPTASVTLAPGKSVSASEAVGLYNSRGAFPAVGQYFTTVTFTVLTPAGTPASATTAPLEVDAR